MTVVLLSLQMNKFAGKEALRAAMFSAQLVIMQVGEAIQSPTGP